jgi:predicted ferric reductase
MVICSICININTDEFGRVSLYGMEFSGAASTLEGLKYDFFYLMFWLLLLVSHVVLLSMLFLTKKTYFQQMLIWIPIAFLVFFMLVNFFSIFLLIPFIGIWLIALIKQWIMNKNQV